MIVAERVGIDAEAADQAVGRLQPGQAAQRGRVADRAAGIGAERAHHQPRRDAGTRAAGRSTGEMLAVPRIACRRPGQVEGRTTVGELMRRQLAEQDGTGLMQLRDGGGVEIRDIVGARARVARRADAGGAVDVLQRERNAVHRAAIVACHDLGFRDACLIQRLVRGDQQIGVELRIDGGDAVEEGAGQRNRRKLSPLDQARGFRDGEEMQIGRARVAASLGIGRVLYTAGRARISSATLRGRNWPSFGSPKNCPPSTITLPRSTVTLGHAVTTWPSHGV